MRDLLLALFWLAAIPLTFVSPVAGVAFWIWDALFSPTELVYSFMASIPTNKIVALTTLFGLLTKPGSRDIYIDTTATLLIMLGASATVSWMNSVDGFSPDTSLYLKLIKEIVLALVIMYMVKEQRWVHICAFMIATSISFLGVKEGLISLLTAGGHKIIGSRSIGDNNQLAAALLVTVPFIIFLTKQVENRFLKFGLIVAGFLDLITVVMTFSRGGFVGLVCFGLLTLTNSKRRIQSIVAILAVGCTLYVLAPAAWFSRVDTINDAYDDSSFMGRVVAWKISWLIAQDNPLFGGGMHAVQHGMVWFRYSLKFADLDWIPTPFPDSFPHAAHSIVFEVLGDLGFVGLAIYVALFVNSYISLRRVEKIARNQTSLEWASDLAQAIKVSFILYVITGLLLSVAYFEMLFVLFALSSRCLRLARQEVLSKEEIERKELSTPLVRHVRPARLSLPSKGQSVRPRKRYTL